MPVVATACDGAISGAGPDDAPGTSGLGGGGGSSASAAPNTGDPATTLGEATVEQCKTVAPDAGVSELGRLTKDQYNNTVSALLGDSLTPGESFLPDAQVGPFPTNAGVAVPEAQLDKYAAAAEAAAQRAVKNLAQLVPCASGSAVDAACARQFIETFGSRAFRRPLQPPEVDRYLALFNTGVMGRASTDGIRLVVTAFLQSPHFLYHLEQSAISAQDGAAKLNEYELAARVSYFITGGPPDAELTAAASQGKVATNLATQAQRLLGTAAARASIERLHLYLLGVDRVEQLQKDSALNPDFTPDVAKAMKAEAGHFASAVIFDGDHTLRSLLKGSFSVLEPALAPVYGLSPSQASGMVQLSNRSGILTLPAVLATYAHPNQTSPIKRGKFVRTNLLCQTLPTPPANVNINPPSPNPSLSTRDRFTAHRADPTCAGCHTLLDPLGFGFEAYDAIGKYRTMEGDLPIDDSGELIGSPEKAAGPFKGASELADKLLQAPELAACVTSQWSTFALARTVSDRDACSLVDIKQRFNDSGGDLQQLALAIVQSQAFSRRRAE